MPPLPRLQAPLTDGVVALREWTERDVDAMAAGFDDPEIARWTRTPSPYTRDDAAAFIAESEDARARGERLSLANVLAADDRVIGSIVLRIEPDARRCDLGNVVFQGHRGRGLGARAGRLVAPYAFDRLGLCRIAILADARNAASVRSSVKAGFTREGALRSYMERDGERVDMVVLSRIPRDLRSAGSG
jgi:RimJ/RimL family protein N-acetyltransferase